MHAVFSVIILLLMMMAFMQMLIQGKYEPEQAVMAGLMFVGFLFYPLAAIAAVLSLFSWITVALLVLMLIFLLGIEKQNVVLTLFYPLATIAVLVWQGRLKKQAWSR